MMIHSWSHLGDIPAIIFILVIPGFIITYLNIALLVNLKNIVSMTRLSRLRMVRCPGQARW